MIENLDTSETLSLRQDMVADQLVSRGVDNDSILQAFREIPRHLFVSNYGFDQAYSDQPLPIKAGQTISQPYVVALMLEYLDLHSHHSVLEFGSGSGYASAVMSKLCREVTGVEVYGDLLADSRKIIKRLGISNVDLHHGSAWEQFVSPKVYDRIILWASPPRIPSHIFNNLKEGGILVAPEGKSEQFVWLCTKRDGNILRTKKDPVRFVPLVQGSVQEIDRNV